MNYYNENDDYCADWLRNLISEGLIPVGVVDDRSIVDVVSSDLFEYEQCHFFTGIGGWPYALELAGWPSDESVWTGSCPCQPFSIAGKRMGVEDERHLWPSWFSLIRECKPSVVFGEQVSGPDGLAWLSDVRIDLESCGYAVGAADLPAVGVGAFHQRQRLWFVADTGIPRMAGSAYGRKGISGEHEEGRPEHGDDRISSWVFRKPDPISTPSLDGLSRPVGIVQAFGNAIVPQVAAEFIRAFM